MITIVFDLGSSSLSAIASLSGPNPTYLFQEKVDGFAEEDVHDIVDFHARQGGMLGSKRE